MSLAHDRATATTRLVRGENARDGELLEHVEARLTGWRAQGAIPRADWRELAALGIVGRETFTEVSEVITELMRSGDVGLVGAYTINEICHQLLILTNSEALRAPVVAGEVRLALCLTEREAGSNMAAIATRAEPRGDGEVLIGEKVYISNSTVADWFLVAARSSAGAQALPTFTLYRVPADRVEVQDMHGLGARLMRVGVVTLDQAPVDQQDVLGRRGRGFRYMSSVLLFERATILCMCVRIAAHVLDVLADWLKTRSVFGLTLAEHEYHRLRFARWWARLRVLEVAYEDLLRVFDDGGVSEADVFALKIEASELVQDLAVEAQHLLGARSWVEGGPLATLYEDIRWLSLGGGATEALLMTIADQRLS